MDKPLRWLIASVLVGALAIIPLAVHDSHHGSDAVKNRTKAAKAFMAEYKSSRYAKYRATQRFKRLRDGTPVIGYDIIVDQDPPRSVSLSGDDQNFVFPGYTISCTRADKDLQCGKGTAPSWDDSVNSEIAALNDYFFSSGVIYVVTQEKGDCFRLDNVFPAYPSPPYGDKARFCFDAKTHVPTRKEVYRGNFADINEFINGGAPQESDFVLPDAAKGLQ